MLGWRLLGRLGQAEGGTFTQVYIPHVDAASHEYGIDHDTVKQAVSAVDAGLAQLAGLLPANVAIVVSADHGLLDTPDEDVHEIEQDDELAEHLAHEPWGTGRTAMFQVREDRTEGVRDGLSPATRRRLLPLGDLRGTGYGTIGPWTGLEGHEKEDRNPPGNIQGHARDRLQVPAREGGRAQVGCQPWRPDAG